MADTHPTKKTRKQENKKTRKQENKKTRKQMKSTYSETKATIPNRDSK